VKKDLAHIQGVVDLVSIATLVITVTTISEDFVMWKAFTRWLNVQGLWNEPGKFTLLNVAEQDAKRQAHAIWNSYLSIRWYLKPTNINPQ
jgi:hypothetical protein